MENAYNISFAFLFLSLLLVIYIPFCILYIDYISEFSIYFQYLMECTDIYLIYGSSGAALPFLTAYQANNVMGSLSHGVCSLAEALASGELCYLVNL
ncbi:hypothetical protein DSF38_20035 [Salmonella enterica subsp. enterica serovar Abony]|nr:hypothetical protein [Salmonella enterica subsp. enterica serovar Abony]